MKKIVERKFNALKNVVKQYREYKGHDDSLFEKELKKVKNKLTSDEYEMLVVLSKKIVDDTCHILSQTRKVFIRLEEDLDGFFDNLD